MTNTKVEFFSLYADYQIKNSIIKYFFSVSFLFIFCILPLFFFFIYFYQLEANYFTILQWVLSYTDMNQPWSYMYSPSRSPLPPPSLPDPSMEYYSAIKKNSFESVPMRWIKLEPIIQSVSQKDKEHYSILTHIYGIQKDVNDNPICKTEKETQMYRTDFWTLWEKARVGCFERIASKHKTYLIEQSYRGQVSSLAFALYFETRQKEI